VGGSDWRAFNPERRRPRYAQPGTNRVDRINTADFGPLQVYKGDVRQTLENKIGAEDWQVEEIVRSQFRRSE
jgi:hypothetical protein